jgi:hypothetical protein
VPVFNIGIFATFVGLGIWQRRRAKIHKAMMLLATVGALSAATSRIDFISALYQDTPLAVVFGPFLGMLALGLLCLIYKTLLDRTIDPWYAIGYIGLCGVCLLVMQLAPTPLWDRFASFLLG